MGILESAPFLFLLNLPLDAGCAPRDGAQPWLRGSGLRLCRIHGPMEFDAHHVQGLWVDEKHVFFTSVRTTGLEGWIFKVDRRGGERVEKRNLARGWDFHPGGIDSDGRRLWVPLAVYTRDSHSFILSVDPQTMKERVEFEVDDHIGALACHGDQIVGANWDAKAFYFWSRKGELREKRSNPTGIAYQDLKAMDGHLACVGGNALDWIEIASWKLVKRYLLEETSERGHPMGREGVAFSEDRVFFLPDDGPDCRLYEYQLNRDE